MVVNLQHKSDSQCIFGGFYQLRLKNIEVTMDPIVERPQSRTNTIIGADFVD